MYLVMLAEATLDGFSCKRDCELRSCTVESSNPNAIAPSLAQSMECAFAGRSVEKTVSLLKGLYIFKCASDEKVSSTTPANVAAASRGVGSWDQAVTADSSAVNSLTIILSICNVLAEGQPVGTYQIEKNHLA